MTEQLSHIAPSDQSNPTAADNTDVDTGSPATLDSGRIEGLDGLRAFAVLSVLAYHLWPTAVPGGFLGVDVFFVISGFLITTLLLREWNTKGRIDLRAFYTRRARRLIPALMLVIVTSIAAAWLVSDDLLLNIQRQVIGALTFSTNWVEIAAGSDYFTETSRPLFLTFWSLAVEEQFYFVWPLLLVALLFVIHSRLLRIGLALAAAAGSVLLMILLFDSEGSVTRVYYGTDTHSFGLMIGVALAFTFNRPHGALRGSLWRKVRPFAGFASLAGLTVLAIFVDSTASSTYPGGLLLASVLSATAVAALPGEATLFTRFCKIPAFAWIGDRSYGIYLWHWPALLIVVAAISPTGGDGGPGWAVILASAGITLALSKASYTWIETPVRRMGFLGFGAAVLNSFKPGRTLYRPTAAAACTMVVLIALAGLGFLKAPAKSRAQLSVESGERTIAEHNSEIDNGFIGTKFASSKDIVDTGSGPAWPPGTRVPPGGDMVGFGDSVMSGAAPALYEQFPGIYINARPILQWRDAPAMVRQMIDKGTMRRVVVLNFGTNAGFKEPESERALRDILDALGPHRRVVLVNTVGVSYWVPSSNQTLLAISREYTNTVVADWNKAAAEKSGLLHRDRTHPNDAGSAIYADVVAEALATLGPG